MIALWFQSGDEVRPTLHIKPIGIIVIEIADDARWSPAFHPFGLLIPRREVDNRPETHLLLRKPLHHIHS